MNLIARNSGSKCTKTSFSLRRSKVSLARALMYSEFLENP